MAESRVRHDWSQASSLLALIANAHRDPKKAKPFKPSDFDPTSGKHQSHDDGPNGTVMATVSAPQKPDTAIRQLWLIPIIGAGMIVLGVATLTLRSWMPSVPMGASLASMATGTALIAMPKVVQEAWWVMALMLGGVAVTYAISWFDNRKKLSTTLPSSPTNLLPQFKELIT